MNMEYTDSNLCYISAVEAIELFKTKELSPVELMKAVIDRSNHVNPTLNCWTYEYFDRAIEQAHAAAEVYVKSPDIARPLEGIPTAIKDFHDVAGEITTYASKPFEHHRPTKTAPTVQRLFDAGAIMHFRSTTSEFAYDGVGQSRLWGTTPNPWNAKFGPGGSSAGAGAAVAAGLTTVADGTDGGGSIRIPASACGIAGYKPPLGRNPGDHEHPGEPVLMYGPLARSVADTALMQNVMSGQHPADLNSLRDEVIIPTGPAISGSVAGMRIALSMDLGYVSVTPEVEKQTLAAAKTFEALGCRVDQVDLGWDWGALSAWHANWEGIFWASMGDSYEAWQYEMEPLVVDVIKRGKQRTVKEFYAVNRVRYDMYQKIGAVFADYDALICPTLATPALGVDHRSDTNDTSFEVNGQRVPSYLGWTLTYQFNLLNQLPVISVPSGFSPATGVPIGLQIVGHAYDDLSVFALATAFEAASPWRQTVPDVPS